MKKVYGVITGACASIYLFIGNAMASEWVDVSGVEIETGPVATLLLTILGALAAIWITRKLIKLANKS